MQMDNLVDLLLVRAEKNKKFPIYSYLIDGEESSDVVDFEMLDHRSKSIAASLQENSNAGDRVMLLFPAGIDFIEAFFGCLYSKRIGVPLPPPRPSRLKQTLDKLLAIASSAEPAVVLTTKSLKQKVTEYFDTIPELKKFVWLSVEEARCEDLDNWVKPIIHKDDIAYLQYTSGSTSLPKGVILTHDNLIHNMKYFDVSGIHDEKSRLLTWLPAFHDLGLIYGLLTPILTITETYIMSNAAFIQRPSRWVEAISRYRITHTMGPNFSFDFCMRSVTEAQKAKLDLSCWQYALNGAEPIRMEVMNDFTKYFESVGFDPRVFSPSWGLAEASCIVSGLHYGCDANSANVSRQHRRSPNEIFVEATALKEDRLVFCQPNAPKALSLVGSGYPIADTEVKIVDPSTHLICAPDGVGEIWIRNKAVSPGYWNNDERTKETFGVSIKGAQSYGKFMRTGDLGFVRDDEVFITGRIKDVIIIRGQNHYPQDIEWALEKCHPLIRVGGSASFSITSQGEERLAVVAEVDRRFKKARDAEAVFTEIRKTVAERFDLQIASISLVRVGTIPKTTSGKIQRTTTKQALFDENLSLKAQWTILGLDSLAITSDDDKKISSNQKEYSDKPIGEAVTSVSRQIQDWLRDQIAELSGIGIDKIGRDQSFGDFGIDSAQSVRLIGEIESVFSFEKLPATLVYDFPTINKLTGKLLDYTLQPKHALDGKNTDVAYENTAALIGMSCCFPGAENVEKFRQLLWNGEQAIRPLPLERQQLLTGLVNNPLELGEAGYIDDVDTFDAAFFNISPREAEQMDPQQRLLLTQVWHALEDAQLTKEDLAGSRTGVFVGISNNDYGQLSLEYEELLDGHAGTGNANSIVANRVSYFLNLSGPSVAVDTACSSSLVAVHLASKSIERGECDTAIVAGVNLLLNPNLSKVLRKAGMLSPSGACHSFDDSADGYVRGEGCGVVVLKKATDAIAEGATIKALITGSAVNQDGRSFGLTAPNGQSQQRVIQEALSDANVSPDQLDYIECHGTGTELGDPIEMGALSEVIKDRGDDNRCYVGSVKSNIGHLEAAAGIAGLIKSVLCLQKGSVPPQAGFNRLNPHIDLSSGSLAISHSGCMWPADRPLACIGVTSMGFGGTNAHVLLRSVAPTAKPQAANGAESTAGLRSFYPLCFSAEHDQGIEKLASSYAQILEDTPYVFPSICIDAATKRTALAHRISVVAESPEAMACQLRAFGEQGSSLQTYQGQIKGGKEPKIALVFSGQGSQYARMGEVLYRESAAYRQAVDRCEAILAKEYDYSVVAALYGNKPLSSAELSNTLHAQISLFVVEYALTCLLSEWGIKPDMVMGHSLGEYVAANVAGALSLSDALHLVVRRAQIMLQCPGEGGMIAVMAPKEQASELMKGWSDELSIAAVNSPEQITVSGGKQALEQFAKSCREARIATKPLSVSHGFHSQQMQPAIEPFRKIAEGIEYQSPTLDIIGNLDGDVVEAYSADYWCLHLGNTVEFQRCVETATQAGVDFFIEVSPSAILSPLMKGYIGKQIELAATLSERSDNWFTLSELCARVYCKGGRLDWRAVFAGQPHSASNDLPLYPFNKTSHWLRSPELGAEPVSPEVPSSTVIEMQPSKPLMTVCLKEMLAPLLRMPPEDIDEACSFLEMGADSLVLVEFVRQISERFGVELPMAKLFEELATIELLDKWLHDNGAVVECTDDQHGELPERAIILAPSHNVKPDCNEPPNEEDAKRLLTPSESFAVETISDGRREWQGIFEKQLDSFNNLINQQMRLIGGADSPNSEVDHQPVKVHKPLPAAMPALAARSAGTRQLNERQQEHLQSLISAYQKKTAASKLFAQEHRSVFADYRSSLGFRTGTKEMLYPLVVESAKGANLWDLDGNEYIDLTMAFGSSLMGYNPKFITDAIVEQVVGGGIQVGPKSPLTGEAAELVAELTGVERVAFANSGTEAVMTAIRMARAVTKKTKIVCFSGSYHGHSDNTLVKRTLDSLYGSAIAPGVASAVAADVIVLDYGDDASLTIIEDNLEELAAIVVEPVQSRRPGLQPKEFIQQVKKLSEKSGCALIFDEIITGFRLAQGGAQEFFGVEADLVTYGKIAGGGMPIGIIAGNSRFMNAIDGGVWNYGDDSQPQAGATFFAGTFSGHPATMAATIAILRYLRDKRGQVQQKINVATAYLAKQANAYFDRESYPIRIDCAGSLFRFVFFNNFSVEFQPIEANLFFYNMTLRGVYIWEGHTCFLSEAHTQEDVDQIIATIITSVKAMREGGFFPITSSLPPENTSASLDNAPTPSEDKEPGLIPEGGDVEAAVLNSVASKLIIAYLSSLLKAYAVGDMVGIDELASKHSILEDYRPLLNRFMEVAAENALLLADNGKWRVMQSFEMFLAGSLPENAPLKAPQSVVNLLNRCAQALPDVLNGKRSATEVLFSGEGYKFIEALYKDAPGAVTANHSLVNRVLEFAHSQPELPLKILEIGAGTGSATAEILPALEGQQYRYVYSDLSAAFLAKASERFSAYSQIDYRVLDVESAPCQQGFESERFDLIIASNVIHATRDLKETCQNLHTLLAPKGQLLLLECVEKQAWLDLIFGLTEGWWRGRHCSQRNGYPLLTESEWEQALSHLGFIQADVNTTGQGQAVITALAENGYQTTESADNATEILSGAQRDILVHMSLSEEVNRAYNEGVLFELNGLLDIDVLKQAYYQLVRRHDSLCVKVGQENNTFVHHSLTEEIECLNFSFIDAAIAKQKAFEWLRQKSTQAFDVYSEALIRAFVVQFKDGSHWLYIVAHHLIIDGVSYGVFIDELQAIYAALKDNVGAKLKPVLSLSDVVGRAPGSSLSDAIYWEDRFACGVPYLDLPTDSPFPEEQTFDASRISATVPSGTAEAMQSLCQRERVTPFMAMLSAYRVLLHKLCGQHNSVIGVPVAVHPNKTTESFVGFGVNVLPLVQKTKVDQGFIDVLAETKKNFLSALEHKYYPFADLVKSVNPKREPSRPPIVTVLFNYESIGSLTKGDMTLTPMVPPVACSKYELTLDVVSNGASFEVVLTYNTRLFTAKSAELILQRFLALLQHLVLDPNRALGQVNLLLPSEPTQLSGKQSRVVSPQCLHEQVEAQALLVEERPAVRCGGLEWSYKQLNGSANQLARLLVERGVKRGDRVAVCMDRTPELISALLAVMKCGAAYVPLDVNYPQERLETILSNSQAKFVLIDSEVDYRRWQESYNLIDMSIIRYELEKKSTHNLKLPCKPDDLAYLIYTSGTTGVPKGVAIEHRNACEMISWAEDEFSAEQLNGVLASTSICFDLSIFEIFLPLCKGHKIILVENILYLPELAKQDDITLLNTVPSAIEELVKQDAVPEQVEVINLAGEVLSEGLVSRIQEKCPAVTIYNLYGPSEDTTYTTSLAIPPGSNGDITIGKPIAGTDIYVLDDELNPVPQGTAGMIYVAGKGLSRGYWGNPKATSAAFIPDPFGATPGQRMYCTGDLGRLNENGELVYLGRQDHQVKFRGHRIELGEIEAVIESVPGIERTVVIATGEQGYQRLIAFYTMTEKNVNTEEKIANRLLEALPKYMIPARLVALDDFPLTPNGKIDRKLLVTMPAVPSEIPQAKKLISSPLLKAISEIWNSYLMLDELDPECDFFTLGGHSLMATQIIFDINRKYACDLRLTDLLKAPTVSEFALIVDRRKNEIPTIAGQETLLVSGEQ